MKIGIIGPCSIKRVCDALNVGEEEYYSIARSIAEEIAKQGHEILIIPAKRSSIEFFAEVYRDEDGPKVIGIIPEQNGNENNSWLNKQVCDEIIPCKGNCDTHMSLLRNSSSVLCIGFCPDSAATICCSKWAEKAKIYIIKELVSQKLPEEVEMRLRINYISANNLKEAIK